MSEALLRDLRVNTCFEQLGCVRMPEIMETDPWNIYFADQSWKTAGESIWVNGIACTLHAHQTIVFPPRTKAQH